MDRNACVCERGGNSQCVYAYERIICRWLLLYNWARVYEKAVCVCVDGQEDIYVLERRRVRAFLCMVE